MGNCFVSKPKKETQSEDQSPGKEALNLFKQKQKLKEDTITEQVKNGGTMLKQDSKHASDVIQGQDDQHIKQRNEKKNKKFVNGILQKDEFVENVEKIEKEKKPHDYQVILNALGQHYFFAHISDQHKEDIVMKMFYCKVAANEFVFQQNDQASAYFIIDQGICDIIINGEVKKQLTTGEGFGELALLYGAPRSASVKTKDECFFWGIDRGTFRAAVEELVQKEYDENRKFIDSIKFFEWMTVDQKDMIAGAIITQSFKKGQAIVNEGDMASSYFIIKSGMVKIMKGGNELRQMSVGDSFGEQALYQNSVRGASVIAVDENVCCLAIGRETITKILGDKIQVIMYNNLLRWSFEKNQLLCKLTKIQIEKIVTKIQTVNYEANQRIYTADQKCDKLVIVLEGKLCNKEKEIATKGQIVGDQFLPKKNREKLVPYDIFLKEGGKVAQIPFDVFLECIGGELDQVIQKNENNHEVKYMQRQISKQQVDYLILDDMIHIKKLGQGQFGSVYLCKNKKDGKLYALKCIIKNQIVEQHLESHLTQEKTVLEQIQFPLMMRFYKSMKDDNFIYFLVEYIKGLELFDVIRDIGLLNNYDSQFYVASLLLCMEYLHTHHIVYRDIKPENVMVDHHGYIRLIDMGTAKILKGKGRTFTIIGTPHYMAPEILNGKGYSYSVDLWSIGICLYEFMCGGVPFAEDAEDPYEIYEEITKKQISYPNHLKDRKAKKFIDQLLNKTPEIRLGGSYAALKANSWFDGLDWDKLMDKELKPPYIPPKDRLIGEKEIVTIEKQNKSIQGEIKNDLGEKNLYKKELAKDPLWDEKFN
ncbi:unnamed protein product [Paramecium pentaurelia]|uniref:cGMP-dependent protein kinase n=1 Tax=Paramecium pentaurelia TaxID=43138 RepID=A0A8S1VCV5_9CILI|nr:unnamed protein product [Paramecium pentaurelia]